MVGATLSRWTMSYFALALVCLVTAQGLMAAGYGFPSAPIEAPQTLIIVHLVVLGWLSLLMCGALFQFVPVLVAKPIYSNALPLPTLILLVAGLVALLLGFLQLAENFAPGGEAAAVGRDASRPRLWPRIVEPRPNALGGTSPGSAARFVTAGLCSLAAAVTLGIVFALVLAGTTAEAHRRMQ